MRRLVLAVLLACLPAAAPASPPSLEFAGTTWHLRWQQGGLLEYTPDGQGDLDRFSDMLSLLPAPAGLGPDDLEAYSRKMAATYENRDGRVLSRQCEPATARHVADCTLLVGFAGESHVELALVRYLALRAGLVAFSLSHREYGDGAEKRAQAWMASSDGQRTVAGFLDWVDAVGLGMDAALPQASASEDPRDVGRVE